MTDENVGRILSPFLKGGIFFEWKVRVGEFVEEGKLLAEIDLKEGRKTIVAREPGTVKELCVTPGNLVKGGQVLLLLERAPCTHEIQSWGLCALCGKDLTVTESKSSIVIAHSHPMLTVSRMEAEKIGRDTTKRLLQNRKLSLVLDLDNTLIHATTERFFQQVPWAHLVNIEAEEIKVFQLPGSPLKYFVKMRPGLKEFLDGVNSLFELHVYTMGTRHYANQISAFIDKNQTLFQDRVLSRDECSDLNYKTLQRIFPCDDSMAVVVDDREDVWKRSKNLIRIEPFVYFTGGPEVNSLPMDKNKELNKPTLNQNPDSPETKAPIEEKKNSEANTNTNENNSSVDNNNNNNESNLNHTDNNNNNNNTNNNPTNSNLNNNNFGSEELPPDHLDQKPKVPPSAPPQQWPPPPDNFLKCTLSFLRKVHAQFYEEIDKQKITYINVESKVLPDVKNIISGIKNEVLKGCKLVFSGLFPIDSDPRKSYEWCHATDLGAECQTDITPQTTHILAVKKGTSKVHRALMMEGVFIVRPDWLYGCIKHWERVKESDYPVAGVPVVGKARPESLFLNVKTPEEQRKAAEENQSKHSPVFHSEGKNNLESIEIGIENTKKDDTNTRSSKNILAPEDDIFAKALRESSSEIMRSPLFSKQLQQMDDEVDEFLNEEGEDNENENGSNDGENNGSEKESLDSEGENDYPDDQNGSLGNNNNHNNNNNNESDYESENENENESESESEEGEIVEDRGLKRKRRNSIFDGGDREITYEGGDASEDNSELERLLDDELSS